MKFSEYMEEAHKTAIYPNQTNNFGLAYLALKLCGEADELYNACHSSIIWDILQETGDVLWYVSQIARTLKINIDQELNEPEYVAYSLQEPFYILKDACIIAEHTGKIYRDAREDTINTELKFYEAMLIDILRHLRRIALGWFSTLETVSGYNLDKLAGRLQQGTLKTRND